MKKMLTKLLPVALIVLLAADLAPEAFAPTSSITHAGFEEETAQTELAPEAPEAPVVIEAPAAEAAVEDAAPVAEEAPAAEVAAPEINPVATIHFDGEAVIDQSLTLIAKISGVPEGVNYKLQWQVTTTGSEADYKDISGETGSRYTFTLTKDNMNYSWRVIVIII